MSAYSMNYFIPPNTYIFLLYRVSYSPRQFKNQFYKLWPHCINIFTLNLLIKSKKSIF